MDARGPLCVGVDPHASLLAAWGLPDTPEGLRRFGAATLAAVAPHAAAIKPQSAFYERHGSRGIAALEELLGAARDAGVLTILDVKRGDIGSTMGGYAEAYLADGAPLAADAVTLSPYLGPGSLRPAVDLALETGRGLFVLALTSNPEGAHLQHAATAGAHDGGDEGSVAGTVLDAVRAWNREEGAAGGPTGATGTTGFSGSGELGSFGLVVGATVGDAVARLGLDLATLGGPLLAPGVGAQGAGPAELAAVFGDARGNVLASTSRGVLRAGPDEDALAAAARRAGEEARRSL